MNIGGKKNTIILLASLVIVISVALILIQNSLDAPKKYEADIQELQKQSTSDEVDVIEKDLLNTNLDNLDTELQDIEKELEQAY